MIRKIFSGLRNFYQQYPASYSSLELLLFLGLYFFNVWVSTFWFWGIYRLNIPVPPTLERLSFHVWHMSPYFILPSTILGLSLLVATFFVRKDPLRELGIRLDNLRSSGRECLIAFFIGTGLILVVFLFHLEDFEPHNIRHYLFWLFVRYPAWGTVQQFWLQSIIFVRLNQIVKNKNATILFAAVIFSLLHAPNIPFMVTTFVAGLFCCFLFSRHRNIFTLGILHALLATMVHALLVPGLISSFIPGPLRNNTAYVAYLRYDNGAIVARPSDSITIPIEVENKSTAVWDSTKKEHPVHISYHLLDAEGTMIAYDNVRTPFPRPIGPGESLNVDVIVTVPQDPGRYQLEIDIVKELVAWFKNKGSLPIRISLVVSEQGNNP